MTAFFYQAVLQWKLDLRNRDVLLTYYLVPLVFFLFMGGILTSLDPGAKETVIPAMSVFAVSMGAFLGAPVPLTALYGSETKKAYQVGRIPLWAPAASNFLSAFVHLFLVSLLILLLAPPLFDASLPPRLSLYLGTMALFLFSCLCLGTALGLFFRTSSRLTMVAQVFFLPSIMLSGALFPAAFLPDPLRFAGRLFPASWSYSLLTGEGGWQAVAALLLISLVALGLCGWRLSKRGGLLTR